ncbi:MAG: tetraacyldisaccharide 4'-kinase [Bacteroidota bacterium]
MINKLARYLLLPVSGVYGIAVTTRNKLFDWNILPSKEFNIPVISVGNLRVGGTGKTPHIEYLVRLLKDQYRVAVLSRGYKRKTRGFIIAHSESSPNDIGDEPCQMKRKFPDIIVAADEKRRRGIEKLLQLEQGPEVILLDDAFQHRYVKPGMNILLDDFKNPMIKDSLLPSGRLREPWTAKKRANIILVTKSPSSLRAIEMRLRAKETRLHEFQHLFYTTLKADELQPVFDGNYDDFRNRKISILLVTGIANPRTVKPLARKISTQIREIRYGDHHNYSNKDIHTIRSLFSQMDPDNSIILTTEKDAVKLREFRKELNSSSRNMFYLPVYVEFLNQDEKNFKAQIINYVSSNKRNSILHKK